MRCKSATKDQINVLLKALLENKTGSFQPVDLPHITNEKPIAKRNSILRELCNKTATEDLKKAFNIQ